MNSTEENIKELFAGWGLWSLVEDISDDGDGTGDNLQLTKEGLEAKRMIEQLLSERTDKVYREILDYSEGFSDEFTALQKTEKYLKSKLNK